MLLAVHGEWSFEVDLPQLIRRLGSEEPPTPMFGWVAVQAMLRENIVYGLSGQFDSLHIASRMNDGSLIKPCCMRAVSYPSICLKARMNSSTLSVTLLAFGSLGVSLNYSLPRVSAQSQPLWLRSLPCSIEQESDAGQSQPFLKKLPKDSPNVRRQTLSLIHI